MTDNMQLFPPKSKFLVTGGAGFIGSNLCEALLNLGYQVRCLDNLSTGFKKNMDTFISNDKFEFIQGDIVDMDTCEQACDGIDYVLHQAAWGSVPRSIEQPLFYEEVNIEGTLNMLEAARKNYVKKFVYASSSSVYGDDPRLPKVEGGEGRVLSPYALTKKTNEEYARLYAHLYGLETIGLRYFNVFGKRQDPNGAYAAVIPKFINKIMNDEVPQINGDGETSRDFTYIENVIEANLKAASAPSSVSGEVFNIAVGGNVTLNELFQTIVSLLGKEMQPIYGEERAGDIRHSHADVSKAKKELGYVGSYDFNQGLSLTIQSYLGD
ncbi:SDR family oxidoreductase [Enterococcus sp. AZ109]|uniref:SDR family oxidoreductase n=1 Tax=Enterococcus sp. AZ109 TaxID=2774634 RepID=UPI003F20ADFC